MKYYCENCGMEFNDMDCYIFQIELDESCPVCGKTKTLKEIPYNETVAQWEARRGEKYPDTEPVYWRYDYVPGLDTPSEWCVTMRKCVPVCDANFVVVATEAGAPDDDWRPE